MLCPGRSVGCRGPALTDRGPAVKGGELLMGLSMQPLSQARLEASGHSAGGSRSALRPHPQTCGAGESEPRQDPTFNLTCPTSRSIVSQEGPIMTYLSVCLSVRPSVLLSVRPSVSLYTYILHRQAGLLYNSIRRQTHTCTHLFRYISKGLSKTSSVFMSGYWTLPTQKPVQNTTFK